MELNTQEEVAKEEVVVTDGIVLSEDECSLLNLGPGFMVLSDLDPEDMEVEAVVTLTKVRWGRRSAGTESMTEEEIAAEDNLKEQDDMVAESISEALETIVRDMIEEEKNSINMGNKRATDMRNNSKVHMPGPGPAKVESSHNVRMGVWTDAFMRHRMNHCDAQGKPHKSNLTHG